MGYFANGTEGEIYEEKYCERCVHDRDEMCPVWFLHFTYNYKAVGRNTDPDLEIVLNSLIPRSKAGLSNEQCTMFIEK